MKVESIFSAILGTLAYAIQQRLRSNGRCVESLQPRFARLQLRREVWLVRDSQQTPAHPSILICREGRHVERRCQESIRNQTGNRSMRQHCFQNLSLPCPLRSRRAVNRLRRFLLSPSFWLVLSSPAPQTFCSCVLSVAPNLP
jgi:hypothetical protein